MNTHAIRTRICSFIEYRLLWSEACIRVRKTEDTLKFWSMISRNVMRSWTKILDSYELITQVIWSHGSHHLFKSSSVTRYSCKILLNREITNPWPFVCYIFVKINVRVYALYLLTTNVPLLHLDRRRQWQIRNCNENMYKNMNENQTNLERRQHTKKRRRWRGRDTTLFFLFFTSLLEHTPFASFPCIQRCFTFHASSRICRFLCAKEKDALCFNRVSDVSRAG